MVCGQNSSPLHVLYGLGARSGFYIFLVVGEKNIKRTVFHDI